VSSDAVRADLDASLPPGLDVIEVVVAAGQGASGWTLPPPRPVEAFLAADVVEVERMTKRGPGTIRGDLSMSNRDNLVHASDSAESAEREIALWFPDL
jgi:hypothetical protein